VLWVCEHESRGVCSSDLHAFIFVRILHWYNIMYREGHHGLNALLYAPIAGVVSVFWSVEAAIMGAVIFVGLSSVPDFDRHFDNNMNSNRSDLWTLVPIKHRGFTHTVWFALLMGGVMAVFATALLPNEPTVFVSVFGFVAGFGGIVGHILGDAVTPMGVKPFNPIHSEKYTLNLFTAKNKVANYGFMIVGGIVLLGVLGWGMSVEGLGAFV